MSDEGLLSNVISDCIRLNRLILIDSVMANWNCWLGVSGLQEADLQQEPCQNDDIPGVNRHKPTSVKAPLTDMKAVHAGYGK